MRRIKRTLDADFCRGSTLLCLGTWSPAYLPGDHITWHESGQLSEQVHAQCLNQHICGHCEQMNQSFRAKCPYCEPILTCSCSLKLHIDICAFKQEECSHMAFLRLEPKKVSTSLIQRGNERSRGGKCHQKSYHTYRWQLNYSGCVNQPWGLLTDVR